MHEQINNRYTYNIKRILHITDYNDYCRLPYFIIQLKAKDKSVYLTR